MKLVIITAMHVRSAMTRAFLAAMTRIRDEFDIQTYSVVTKDDDGNLDLLKEYGFPYIEYENRPVGQKWNQVVRFAGESDYTHMMILGSDDFLSPALMDMLINLMDGRSDMIGIIDCFFYNARIKELSYFGGYTNRRKGESLDAYKERRKNALGKKERANQLLELLQ